MSLSFCNRIFAFTAGLAISTLVSAHEFWLQPDDFTPAPNSIVKLHLMVGDGMPGEGVGRNPDLLIRLTALTAKGNADLPGRPGMDPAGMMRVAGDDLITVIYQSRNSSVTLEPAKFESYLQKVGLESIIAQRAQMGQTTMPGREVYARCCKTLLRVGAGAAVGYDCDADLPLELTPLSDPYQLAPNGDLALRLDYLNAPLENGLVTAFEQSKPDVRISGRTDSHGIVHLTLPEAGMWMISSVHMIPAAPDSGADWQSYWASFTFDLQPSAASSAGQ